MSSSNNDHQQPTTLQTLAQKLLADYAEGKRDFRCANLSGATLSGATLSGATLRDADLRGATLIGATLIGADLSGATLSGADLIGATLRGATLSDATLTIEQLRAARTDAIRDDLYGYLAHVPHEVPGLLAALEAGKIDGSTYNGPCACLAGTCERLRGDAPVDGAEPLPALRDLRDPDSARERWFLAIQPGDTPENHAVAALTAEWLRAWLAEHPATESNEEAGA